MELKQFSQKDLKAINNGADIGLLPKFLNGTPSLTPKLPSVKPIPSQGWSYKAAINTNTGGKGLTFNNPITPTLTKNTSGPGLNQTPSLFFGRDLSLKSPSYGSNGPTLSDSNAAAIHHGFAIGAWLGGGVLEGINRIKSADEHLADAGTSEANINGIAYTQQNTVDAGQIMSEYDKTTAKDFLTNPGRGLASLFGRSKAKREAENAAIYADLQQEAARDTAYGKFLQLDFAKRYGNTEDQVLYAKNGKLPKCKDGLVSATGIVNGEATARVSNGEVIANKELGTMFRVPGLKNNKDGKLAALNNSDTVITNKYGLSDYAWRTGDIAGAEKMMAMLTHPGYKCGKLPGHAEGWLGNFVPAALGTLASLDQTINAYKNKPYRPNTYASNPYEMEGLTTLAGLRMNPYPIINQLRDAEYRSNRAVDLAGGLSGSLRTAARLANLNTTQKNIANLLSSVQQQNNAYRANYALAAINAGQASRQARMQANQWDLDYYSKAHAARNKGIQTGIANMLAQIQQYQANEFKRRQFNDTMQLYRDDMDQRKKNFEWMANQSTRGVGADPATNNLTTPLYGGLNSTYFGMKDPLGVDDWLLKYRGQYNAWRNSLPASLRYRGGIG